MEIHWVEMGDLDERERGAIEAELEQLAKGYSDLIDIRISGHKTGHHVHGDQEVRIACQVRGEKIVAVRNQPDLGLALNQALDVFKREVRKLREKRRDRRAERIPEPPYLGIVDRIYPSEGYGFILTDDGERVYFHRNAVKAGLSFQRLEEADRVALDLEPGDEGLQATAVLAPPPGES